MKPMLFAPVMPLLLGGVMAATGQPAVDAGAEFAIIDEIISRTEFDGIVFDFMRTYYNQTVETLVDLFSETRKILDKNHAN